MTLDQIKSLLRWINTFKRDFCDFLNYECLTKNKKSWIWLSHRKTRKNIFIQKKEDTYANQAWMKVFGKFTLRVIDRVFNWKFYGLGENYKNLESAHSWIWITDLKVNNHQLIILIQQYFTSYKIGSRAVLVWYYWLFLTTKIITV